MDPAQKSYVSTCSTEKACRNNFFLRWTRSFARAVWLCLQLEFFFPVFIANFPSDAILGQSASHYKLKILILHHLLFAASSSSWLHLEKNTMWIPPKVDIVVGVHWKEHLTCVRMKDSMDLLKIHIFGGVGGWVGWSGVHILFVSRDHHLTQKGFFLQLLNVIAMTMGFLHFILNQQKPSLLPPPHSIDVIVSLETSLSFLLECISFT